MKPDLSALRQALWLAAGAALAGALAWGAVRLARSMQRGRGAAFTLAGAAGRPPEAPAYDFLARWTDGRYAGPSADEAWQALARCPGPAPRREGDRDRRVAVVLPDEGRPAARRALHLASGGQAEFSFVVPSSATLTFDTGARAEAGGVLDMVLELAAPGRPVQVLDERKVVFISEPPGAPRPPRNLFPYGGLETDWRPVSVDLSPWAGRAVTVRLRAVFRPDPNVPSSTTAHGFWAGPTVWAPDGRRWERPVGLRNAARGPWNLVWVVFEGFPTALHGVSTEDFPGLDVLAREGVEFQRAYTNWTDGEEGLRGLLTGRQEPGQEPGPPPSLPRALKEAGYRTALFGAPGADPGPWTGLGFDLARAAPPPGAGGETSLREAAQWLAQEEGRGPRLLVVFVRAPVRGEDPSPRCWARAARLSPLSPFRGRRWKTLAQAVQMEGALERLWSQEVRLGGRDRTLLTAVSLRGPAFRPEPLRRRKDGLAFRSPLPSGWGLREEEVRTLWLMRPPGLAAGRKVTAPAQLLDAAPTLLDLLGVAPPEEMEGRSFAAKPSRAAEEEGARFLIKGRQGEALVLDGHYKYVRRGPARNVAAAGTPARTDFEPEELFDLWTDPGEHRNLARRRRDLLARARRAIDERSPERTAVRLVFQGYEDPPIQGTVVCPGGDLWNVSLSTGTLSLGGTNQASFTVSAPEAAFTFETWPPPASYTLSLRVKGRIVPAEDIVVSRLGLPLIETEKRTDWFDGNKFPWMEGVPAPAPRGDAPRVLMGREPLGEDAP